jgi:hypothetical protein
MAASPSAPAERVEQAADALYTAPLSDFVAERGRLASEARKAGDRAAAAGITALRKPTQSAWLVNQLVRRRGDVVGQLSELGEALREAEQTLTGAALRQVGAQRSQLVAALVAEAVGIAGEAGSRPAADTLAEVQATFEAALADPAAAEEVSSGRLSKPLSYVGFAALVGGGGAPAAGGTRAPARPASTATTAAATRKAEAGTARERQAREREARRQAEAAKAARAAAEKALEEARAAHLAATEHAERSAQERTQLAEDLADLRLRVADLERRSAEASLEARASAQAAARTAKVVATAEAALRRLG